MTKALVDTTVLVDALLKPGPRANAAKAALARYEQTILPAYAIKEFRCGALYNYVWVYNKLLQTGSMVGIYSAINAMRQKMNLVATALEALDQASIAINQDWAALKLKYDLNDADDIHAILADEYKFYLRGLIDKAWMRRRTLTSSVSNEIPCFHDRDPIEHSNSELDLKPLQCDRGTACCAARDIHKDSSTIEEFCKALDGSPKKENINRQKVLRKIASLKVGQLDRLKDGDCRALGDAMFVYYCPADAVVLTTNITDHQLLANAVGKVVDAV